MYTTLLHVVVKINNELFLIHVQGILHVHMCVHTSTTLYSYKKYSVWYMYTTTTTTMYMF